MTNPAFIIIGARRCGTTSLYNYLAQHPDIGLSHTPLWEHHFFDQEEHWQRGVDWYRQQFPNDGRLYADKSPTYFHAPHVPARVKEALPDVKLILLLRDPIERIASDYTKRVQAQYEQASFSEAIRREIQPTNGADYWESDYHLFDYIGHSRYQTNLDRWVGHFGETPNFIILQSESFYCRPVVTCHIVFRFLGLWPMDIEPRIIFQYSGRDWQMSQSDRDYLAGRLWNEGVFGYYESQSLRVPA